MNSNLRSRGIRLIYNRNRLEKQGMKTYYEPDCCCQFFPTVLTEWINSDFINIFEYSEVEGLIDTFNFHVNLCNQNYHKIYDTLPKKLTEIIDIIPYIFDESFRNYTVGYQIQNGEIVGESFYFYPTIWKEKRYGIRGTTDRQKIITFIKRFSQYLVNNDPSSESEILSFANILYKFKGISIHYKKKEISYKLYGRADEEKLNVFLGERGYCKADEDAAFGHTVLIAQRINKSVVAGYNLYYLS